MVRTIAVLIVAFALASVSSRALSAQGMNVSVPTALPIAGGSDALLVWASSPIDEPDRLLVCTTEEDTHHGENPSVAYVSFDDGGSWTRSLVDRGNWGWVTETACATDTDGRAYFVGSASGTSSDVSPQHAFGSTRVFRSSDGGLTWSIIQRVPFIDWNLLAIDQGSNGLRHRMFLFGNIIASGIGDAGSGHWRDIPQPLLEANDDDAAGFSEPRFPFVSGQDRHLDHGVPIDAVVLNDGTALALYSSTDKQNVVANIYRANVDSYSSWSTIRVPDGYSPTGGLSGQLAYDRKSGALYVSYTANKGSEDVLALARSQDGGKNWQSSILLRKVAELSPDQRKHTPTITGVAVNLNGTVGMQWVPIVGCPVFALSTDHGESLSESQTLGRCVNGKAPAASAVETNLIEPFSLFQLKTHWLQGDTPGVDRSNEALGFEMRVDDYDAFAERWSRPPLFGSQVVADAHGNFHTFWTEQGQDGRFRLLTSTIQVTVSPPFHVDLRSANDLTDQVVMNIMEQQYDPTTATFELDASVRNKSTVQITYPNVLEVLADRSECGTVNYLNSYGTSEDGHVVYRVPTPPFKNYLAPGEQSQAVHFQIKVGGCEATRTDLIQAALKEDNLQSPWRSLGYFPLGVRFRALATALNGKKF